MKLSHYVVDEASPKIKKLEAGYEKTVGKAIHTWAQMVRARLKSHPYPPQRNAPQPFKTDRSRRWFFWALRSGLISVPYTRTGLLANSWSAHVSGWSGDLRNSAAHAGLVVGDEQVSYHRPNWWLAEDVVVDEVPELEQEALHAIEDLVS